MELPPAYPPVDPIILTFPLKTKTIAALPSIPGIPDGEDVLREHTAFLEIEEEKKEGSEMDDDSYANSIIRHHSVLCDRWNADKGNPGTLTQLLDRLINLEDTVREGFLLVEARRSTDYARQFNSPLCSERGMFGFSLKKLVKDIAGHPHIRPPQNATRLDDPQKLIEFANGYQVGSDPPEGLFPQNFQAVSAMDELAHDDLNRALRSLHWFYNDSRLNLIPQAGVVDTRACYRNLKLFLTSKSAE